MYHAGSNEEQAAGQYRGFSRKEAVLAACLSCYGKQADAFGETAAKQLQLFQRMHGVRGVPLGQHPVKKVPKIR